MSRRDLIRQALTVGAVAAGARVAGAQEVGTSAQQGGTAGVPRPALREIGKQRNLLVGTAVSYAQLQRPDFAKLLAEQAAIVVAENEMKWQRIHPEPERYEFA
ncbi:MAG: endo-1,4-beta-xylanase, partial [Acidobacteriaceae bacterium]|nr:endo-1,4-beta-xylanase [Acidobacteriaceae bacterium]